MNPHRKMNAGELLELHKQECNHFVNGECQTVACMRWDGQTLVRPPEFVGCLHFQTVKKFEAIARACELWDQDHIDGYAGMATVEFILDQPTSPTPHKGEPT